MLVLLVLLGFGSFGVTCCFGLAVVEGLRGCYGLRGLFPVVVLVGWFGLVICWIGLVANASGRGLLFC